MLKMRLYGVLISRSTIGGMIKKHKKEKALITQLTYDLFKVSNRNTRKRCEICSNLTIKIPVTLFWCFYCLTWNIFHTFFKCFFVVVDFEQ